MTPRIAIPIPTTIDLAYNERSWKNYAAAVTAAGGEPVAIGIGANPAEIREIFATCQGLCLPGSPADVAPEKFGEERIPECGPQDVSRELADWTLLDAAEKRRVPVLAICYGVQSLNVWRGGSLVQDLAPLPVNHSAGSSVAIAHSALIPKDSLLGSLLDPAEAPEDESGYLRLPVNTSHHQAVSQPGTDLRIVARCPDDGVIEAVELPQEGDAPWWVIGVQWHPERSIEISAASRALFARLTSEANRLG